MTKLFRIPIVLAAALGMLGAAGGSFAAAADEAPSVSAVLIEGENKTDFAANEMDSLWARAVQSARSGGNNTTIKLLDDWYLGGCKTVGSGTDLTIDLNGHIIDRGLAEYKSDGNLFTVENGGRLTFSDSDPKAVHKRYAVHGGILTGGKSGDTGGCIEMKAGSAVTLNGCAVMSCATQQDGGAVRMDGVCELNVDGTQFCSNFAMDSRDKCHGGAIYISDGTAVIKNAVFDSNYTENSGGAIYINDGKFIIENTVFRGNASAQYGGAVHIAGSYETPDINGCAFLLNTCGEDGGAVNVSGGKGVNVKGSVFAQNRADKKGGAMYIESDCAALISSTVNGNYSGENGGGIYVDSRYDINVQGKVVIKDNTCGGQNSRNNLCLQSGVASTAYLSGSGLYEGSVIYLSSTKGDGKIKVAKDFSEFQRAQYIRADSGSTFLDPESTRQVSERFVSSVIGGGSIAVILTGLMTMILAVLGVCIYRTRKSKKSITANARGGEV